MNMFLIIHVKPTSAGTYNTDGDHISGPDTVCDSVLCNDNYRVEDHKCIVCAPGTYNWREMMLVDPIQRVIRHHLC